MNRKDIEIELQKLESITNFKTFKELNSNNERINILKRILSIMDAISNVITKRKNKGASEQDINAYKQHLIKDIWMNNEIIMKYIKEI